MFRKVVDYQKLFYRSVPSPGYVQANLSKFILGGALYWIGFMMMLFLTSNLFPAVVIMGSLSIVNRHFNADAPLFKRVPVSRKFAFFNTYLATLVIAAMIIGIIIVGVWILIALLLALSHVFPGISVDSSPIPTPDTGLQGNLFGLVASIIVLLLGTSIVFLRRPWRIGAFVTLYGVCYGLLRHLKGVLPPHLTTGTTVHFIAGLPLAPQSTSMLIGLGVFALIAVPASMYAVHRMYMSPEMVTRR